jgi:hypothetical protein
VTGANSMQPCHLGAVFARYGGGHIGTAQSLLGAAPKPSANASQEPTRATSTATLIQPPPANGAPSTG